MPEYIKKQPRQYIGGGSQEPPDAAYTDLAQGEQKRLVTWTTKRGMTWIMQKQYLTDSLHNYNWLKCSKSQHYAF